VTRLIPAAVVAALAVAAPSATGAAERPFPATVRAANGKVTVPERPRRIVVLAPTHTETVFAIGAGRQVVAVDDESNHPRRAPRTRLSAFRPSAEAVARHRPDLVITSTASNRLLPALRRLRIPVLLAPAATHIGGAYEQMKQIGTLTGHRPAADRLIRRTRRRIDRAVRSARRGRGLTVFHELSPDLFSVTSRSFVGRIYRLFGLRNIADPAGRGGNAYPQLSAEHVLSADPDLIVLADTRCCKESARTVAARPGWRAITAVRRRNVFAADDDVASRWGPRLAGFVELVARAVRRASAGR
jgi:iron complex transport system substrate-binding protein